jgi:hypothetical protein
MTGYSGESAVESRRPYELALAEIKGRAAMDGNDSFEIASNVADKIMSADSLQGIMDAASQGPEDLSDLEGTAFYMVGESLRFAESAEQFREGGTGYYAIFRCLDLNGTEHTVSTGAVNVIFQLRAMEKQGVFDAGIYSEHAFTVKSRPTKRGTLYRLDFAL